jgi:hypothetical protein
LLIAAGRLDETEGGPSVSLTTAPFSTRRSVYGFIERQNLPAFFRTFDFANPNTHTPERPQTVSPQQALFLMNSPFVIEQATHLAERTASSTDATPRVAQLFRDAIGRDPTVDELADALAFVDQQEGTEPSFEGKSPPVCRWEQLAQVLLMSNEFAFVD